MTLKAYWIIYFELVGFFTIYGSIFSVYNQCIMYEWAWGSSDYIFILLLSKAIWESNNIAIKLK